MIKASDIAKGTFILINNQPHVCTEREYVNPGKGSAFVRLKLKNIKTGSVLRQTNKVQDNLEDVSVEYKEVQFLYADNESYAFMDTKTYEQFTIPIEGEEEKRDFLKDGENYQVVFWEQTPIDIKLPTKMVFTVVGGGKGRARRHGERRHEGHHLRDGPEGEGAACSSRQGDRILVNTETAGIPGAGEQLRCPAEPAASADRRPRAHVPLAHPLPRGGRPFLQRHLHGLPHALLPDCHGQVRPQPVAGRRRLHGGGPGLRRSASRFSACCSTGSA